MDPEFLKRLKDKSEAVLQTGLLPPPRKPQSPGGSGLASKGFGGGQGSLPRYTSSEALQFTIDEYFTRLQEREFYGEEEGKKPEPPTMAGLALALGFSSTKTMSNYVSRGEDFEYVLDTAKTRIEKWKNELLLRGGTTTQAAIFDLKNNHGWADKSEKIVNIGAGDSLALLVQELQGKVHRPVISQDSWDTEVEQEAEWEEVITKKKKPAVFKVDSSADIDDGQIDSDLTDMLS